MWEGLRPSLEKFCLKSIFGKDNDIYNGGDVCLREKELPSSSKSHDVQAKKRKNRLLCKFSNCKIKPYWNGGVHND